MKATKEQLERMIEDSVNKILKEGFDSYTVMGSDNAAIAASRIFENVEKQLLKELKSKGNAYNTSGPINVAMILLEFINPRAVYYMFNDNFINKVLDALEPEAEKINLLKKYIIN